MIIVIPEVKNLKSSIFAAILPELPLKVVLFYPNQTK
jgi:hypothetical protein